MAAERIFKIQEGHQPATVEKGHQPNTVERGHQPVPAQVKAPTPPPPKTFLTSVVSSVKK